MFSFKFGVAKYVLNTRIKLIYGIIILKILLQGMPVFGPYLPDADYMKQRRYEEKKKRGFLWFIRRVRTLWPKRKKRSKWMLSY